MSNLLEDIRESLLEAASIKRYGKVIRMVGMSIEVAGVTSAIGDGCLIYRDNELPVMAEVVALNESSLICLPYGSTNGLKIGALVEPLYHPLPIHVGHELLGRVVDGLGMPIDDGPSVFKLAQVNIDSTPPHPLKRKLVTEQLELGVKVLDSFVPCGKGQRLGIFAGSGVGKSSLMSMIIRGTKADVSVVALIGERGREVSELIERDIGKEGLKNSVVVVATSDAPALVRIRAAFTATRIAEWFRDQGKDVLLFMDSLTRFAMAQREVGLAAGEPPATRGYPPSVFGLLPKLLERAGTAERGSITGLYTVLVEGDDMNEPIADSARSILDGHIQLSRQIAEKGHYPAVDVLGSISRVAPAITSDEIQECQIAIRRLLAAYRDSKDLIEINAYVPGTDPDVDAAIKIMPLIDEFTSQKTNKLYSLDETMAMLRELVAGDES